MALSVCFDALGTCFSLDVLVQALEQVMGQRLGPGVSRMIVMDWLHAAQRDYAYLSITSPPPPPIAQILKATLSRSIAFALQSTPSTTESPSTDLSSVLEKLSSLTPAQGLESAWKQLHEANANVVVVTNGSQATTQGYIDQAGLGEYVHRVKSCDEVGLSKPFAEVYEMAKRTCTEVEYPQGEREGERWFVAAHLWDLHAARKAGFKTGYVLSEQPPIEDGQVKEGWWEMYGGRPDVVGADLAQVVSGLLQQVKSDKVDTS